MSEDIVRRIRVIDDASAPHKKIKNSIVKDVKEMKAESDKSTKSMASGWNTAKSAVAGFAGVFAAYQIVSIVKGTAFAINDLSNAASDLNETISKGNEIFGLSARQLDDWSKSASKTFGQSRVQALDAAATFGIFGKSAGLSGNDLTDFSKKFTELASDLASFHNASPEEAIISIGSALRGEAEPIRRFGVLLDDASLREIAFREGLIKTTKNALTPQQKVLAASKLIFEQTADAQGDFARTADGLANTQRTYTAEIEAARIEIGEQLMPIMKQYYDISLEIIKISTPFLKEMAGTLTKLVTGEDVKRASKYKDYLSEMTKEAKGINDYNQERNKLKNEAYVIEERIANLSKSQAAIEKYSPQSVAGYTKKIKELSDELKFNAVKQRDLASEKINYMVLQKDGRKLIDAEITAYQRSATASELGKNKSEYYKQLLDAQKKYLKDSENARNIENKKVSDEQRKVVEEAKKAKERTDKYIKDLIDDNNKISQQLMLDAETNGVERVRLQRQFAIDALNEEIDIYKKSIDWINSSESQKNEIIKQWENTRISIAAEYGQKLKEARIEQLQELFDTEQSIREQEQAKEDARISNEKQALEKRRDNYIDFGKNIGYAISSGIKNGEIDLKESLKSTLVVMVDFLQKQAIAAVAGNTLVSVAQLGFAGLAKAAIQAGVITAAFETAKAGIMAFENSGIVPGTSYTGDRVPAMVNSGEMVLNRRDQSNLYDMIKGNASSNTTTNNNNHNFTINITDNSGGLIDSISASVRNGDRGVDKLINEITRRM